jgi:hypothetical protein
MATMQVTIEQKVHYREADHNTTESDTACPRKSPASLSRGPTEKGRRTETEGTTACRATTITTTTHL